MRRLPTIIFIMLLLLVGSEPLMAQSGTAGLVVIGRVLDDSKEPLAGANVYVKGHIHKGTSTDIDGNFSLKLPSDKKIVI